MSSDIFEASTEEDTEDETDGGVEEEKKESTEDEEKAEETEEAETKNFDDILPSSPEDIRYIVFLRGIRGIYYGHPEKSFPP